MFKEKNIEDRGLKNFQKQNFDIVKIEGLYKMIVVQMNLIISIWKNY